jgi:capsular exopolysaccharide synthesis family protein
VLLGAFLGLACAFLVHAQKAAVYQSSCQLLVIKKRNTEVIPMSSRDQGVAVVEEYMSTHLVLLKSPLILKRAVEKATDKGPLSTLENVGDPVGYIQSNLTVSRDQKDAGPSNNIVQLAYRGPIAEDTGTILKAIIDSYQEFLDITYKNVSDDTYALITKARDLLHKDMKDKEEEYLTFYKKSNMDWRGKDGVQVEYQRVSNIDNKYTEYLLKQKQLKERIRNLEKAITDGTGDDFLAMQDHINASREGSKSTTGDRYVMEQVLPLILKKQDLLVNFGPDHPEVVALNKRIQTLQESLREISPNLPGSKDYSKRFLVALKIELSEIDTMVNSLNEELEKTKERTKTLGLFELMENKLKNEMDNVKDLYKVTIKRLQEINMIRESGGFEARKLSNPGIGIRVGPNAPLDLGVGLLLGLLAGVGLGYLADLSDKSFRNPEEIRRRLGLPLVGHIALLTPDAEAERRRAAGELTVDPLLCTHFRPKSLDAEAYRAVRTALYFSTQGTGRKVIQVTSPNKGDGKSLTIANLAITIAQSGKKILLIDADCRRPRQHKIFGIEPEAGLANVLIGEVGHDAVIVPTSVPGLSLLPCGPIPPNPSELLISPRFTEILEMAREAYDYVLVDTPPLLAVTDPCVVAGRIDGLFLTIRLSRKGRPDAERAREILHGLGVKIFGIVVNGVTRGNAGIYSAATYDYSYSYEDYQQDNEQGYYYSDEEEEVVSVKPPPKAVTPSAPEEAGVAHTNGKGFWDRLFSS